MARFEPAGQFSQCAGGGGETGFGNEPDACDWP
jgi:hypothetical protein